MIPQLLVGGGRAGRQWIKVFQCRAPNNRLSRYVTPLFSTGFTMPLYFGPSLNSSMVVVMKTILRRMNKLLEKRCLIWNRCGSSFADGQRLMVLLFDALFTCSPSDNSSDKEDFAAMWGLHESLVWTSGNSWLNHSSSCFWSWTLFLPVEVSTVKAIFLHSDMHILNLFLSWSMLNGKLPSSYFWPNSLSTSACISAFLKFFVFVKINFLL